MRDRGKSDLTPQASPPAAHPYRNHSAFVVDLQGAHDRAEELDDLRGALVPDDDVPVAFVAVALHRADGRELRFDELTRDGRVRLANAGDRGDAPPAGTAYEHGARRVL